MVCMKPDILLIFDMDFTLIDLSPVDFSAVLTRALEQTVTLSHDGILGLGWRIDRTYPRPSPGDDR